VSQSLQNLLEPGSLDQSDEPTIVIGVSQAISLKRIADALEKLTSGDVNAYGVGAEIGRGMGDFYVSALNQAGR
jgi:hypothetical protein